MTRTGGVRQESWRWFGPGAGPALAVPCLAVALALALAGCSAAPEPETSFTAPLADVSAVAGEWSGSYWSVETGRSGVIHFTLEAQSGIAAGHVLMGPSLGHRPLHPSPEGGVVQSLAIRFVAVRSGVVSGALEPYRDPECGCLVSTNFTGELRGDVISGSFVSTGGGGSHHRSGRWRVERVEPTPHRSQP